MSNKSIDRVVSALFTGQALRQGASETVRNRDNVVPGVEVQHPVTGEPSQATIYLQHGHQVATLFDDGTLVVSDCTWQTRTTKDRINAFLDQHGGEYGIRQRDWCWYLLERQGRDWVELRLVEPGERLVFGYNGLINEVAA